MRVFRKRLPERRSGEQRCGRSARKKTGQPRILCQTRSKNLPLISNLLVKLTPKIFELVTNGKTKIWRKCPSMTKQFCRYYFRKRSFFDEFYSYADGVERWNFST